MYQTHTNTRVPVTIRETKQNRERLFEYRMTNGPYPSYCHGQYPGIARVYPSETIWKNPYSARKHGKTLSLHLYEQHILTNLVTRLSELEDKVIVCETYHRYKDRCAAEVLCDLVRDKRTERTSTTHLAAYRWKHLPKDVLYLILPYCPVSLYYNIVLASKRCRDVIYKHGRIEEWVISSLEIAANNHYKWLLTTDWYDNERGRNAALEYAVYVKNHISNFIRHTEQCHTIVKAIIRKLIHELVPNYGGRMLININSAFDTMTALIHEYGARQVLLRASYKFELNGRIRISSIPLPQDDRYYQLFAEYDHAYHSDVQNKWYYCFWRTNALTNTKQRIILDGNVILTQEEIRELAQE